MSIQKILSVNRRDGSKLIIVSDNISHAESIGAGMSRVYFGYNQSIDISRDITWVKKHLVDNYAISEANELWEY